jgi:hypothetical protein
MYSGDEKNHEASPENTKDTIPQKMFLKVLLCIRVFVFESKKSQPKAWCWECANSINFYFKNIPCV